MKRFAIVAAVLLTACAGVTDVVSTGPDTFMVASQGVAGNGSGAAQKIASLKAADSYCKERGGVMQEIRSEQSEPMFGRAPSAQVEFRCVAK